jgi:ribosomal peptide maturation radical SAM protein 1
MRIVLVHMPWGAIDVPSLALGILRTSAGRRGHDVEVRHANLDFVDWITDQLPFGLSEYRYYSDRSYFQGAGDWVFSSALYDGPGRFDRFARLLADSGSGPAEIALTRTLHGLVPTFVTSLVSELVALEPDVVGFTTTFQQNTASLAAARLLHERAPRVRTVLGGANCDGPQGAALHRNFPFLDFVVRGEGETAFPALLDAIDAGVAGRDDLARIPGLCWREPSGASTANPMSRRPLPPGGILPPDYDGFVERLDASAAATWVEPKLVVEGSRGCWWGEKHHCTFCGLNGSFMEFRSKGPDRFVTEVLELARRHQLLDFFVVDNILDMTFFDSALRGFVESGYDLRLHFEVKSNLRRHHFEALREAGVVQVQPGIESLNTRVLRLMDKGVSGCQNVRALRDAQSAGVTTSWNYLYGFPGESPDDYTAVIDQLPRLHHLEPPTGAMRIAIERFSPYFDRPDLGFRPLRLAPQYAETYRLPESELADLAYVFAAPVRGIDARVAGTLSDAIDRWREEYPHSRLTFEDLGDRIVLVSHRPAYDWTVLELSSDVETALFRLLDRPRSPETLSGKVPGGAEVVQPLLDRWADLGLVFHDDGTYLQIAAESRNQVLLRVDHRYRPGAAGATGVTGSPGEARHAAVG